MGVKWGSYIDVFTWCRSCRANQVIFWVNRLALDVWGKDLILCLTDIIGFSGERWCFLGWGMADFGFCINMVPINGWDTNNVWHVYGRGGHTHARNDVKIIMWSKLHNARADHVQLLLHSGFLNKRMNLILIWRNPTLDPWHFHGMIYLHDWRLAGSIMVHSYRDPLTEC